MPDIPKEAVRAAEDAYRCAHTSGVPEREIARIVAVAAVEAAAPAIAAQARARALQDATAGRVTLEEWAAVQGVTVPQRIEDLQTKESFTPEEVEAFFAVADEPSCCDQVRRETAEQIAAHFDDMVVTREYRRRFEDRHAEHLANGVTAHGLLSAVVDEIKALPERTETDA